MGTERRRARASPGTECNGLTAEDTTGEELTSRGDEAPPGYLPLSGSSGWLFRVPRSSPERAAARPRAYG